MLRISLIEFILRIVPEAFLIMLAFYLLNYKRVNTKRYIISSVFIAISTYLVRMLPINYGVHTIINMIICILVIVSMNKISSIKAISAVIKVTTLIAICEWVNIIVLDKVMKLDLKMIFKDPLKKMLYSTPSILMLSIIILLFYKFQFKTRIEVSNIYD